MSIEPEFDNLTDMSDSEKTDISSESIKTPTKKLRVGITLFNVFTSLLLVISIIVTAAFGILAYIFKDMRFNATFPNTKEELGIDQEIVEQLPENNITNILLFGIDNRTNYIQNRKNTIPGRSDTMMVMSIDEKTHAVKLTSLLRDSWVDIEGHKKNKLNAAYAFGGPTLAIKTINQTYGLDIQEYITVSINQFGKIVDILNGIDIYITEAERVVINENCAYDLESAGLVHLNGTQAITYSRIRKIDGEDVRARRQQKVLICIFEKLKKKSLADYPSLLQKILSFCETSLSFDELMSYAPMLLDINSSVQSTTVPGKEVPAKGGIFSDTRGGWVWKYDFAEAQKYIHGWIYGIEEEKPSDDTSSKDVSSSGTVSSDQPTQPTS